MGKTGQQFWNLVEYLKDPNWVANFQNYFGVEKVHCKTRNNNQQYQEESVIDPVKMASMLVSDNKLFQEPKKLEKNDGEEDEFSLKFDLREQ